MKIQPLLGTALACAALAACDKAPTPPPAPSAVFVSEVRNDSGSQDVVLSGSVRPRIESDLGFRAAGKIASRHVDVGQAVKAGQAMARLDPADYQLSLGAAREQVRAAEVDAVQGASDAARFRRLLDDGSISAADVERQQAKSDAAAARLAQARQQLALASNRVGYTTLAAPFDGVVTAIRMEAGQVISEGQPVITLARPGELEVVADIPEALAASLRSYSASARLADGTSNLPVRLRELAPSAAAQTRTFRARYALPGNSVRSLSIGATAELHLSRRGPSPAALLPAAALLSTDGKPTVWVVDEQAGALARKTVSIVASASDTVRVAGLNDRELVVSAGTQKLDAGMKVRPVRRALPLSAEQRGNP